MNALAGRLEREKRLLSAVQFDAGPPTAAANGLPPDSSPHGETGAFAGFLQAAGDQSSVPRAAYATGSQPGNPAGVAVPRRSGEKKDALTAAGLLAGAVSPLAAMLGAIDVSALAAPPVASANILNASLGSAQINNASPQDEKSPAPPAAVAETRNGPSLSLTPPAAVAETRNGSSLSPALGVVTPETVLPAALLALPASPSDVSTGNAALRPVPVATITPPPSPAANGVLVSLSRQQSLQEPIVDALSLSPVPADGQALSAQATPDVQPPPPQPIADTQLLKTASPLATSDPAATPDNPGVPDAQSGPPAAVPGKQSAAIPAPSIETLARLVTTVKAQTGIVVHGENNAAPDAKSPAQTRAPLPQFAAGSASRSAQFPAPRVESLQAGRSLPQDPPVGADKSMLAKLNDAPNVMAKPEDRGPSRPAAASGKDADNGPDPSTTMPATAAPAATLAIPAHADAGSGRTDAAPPPAVPAPVSQSPSEPAPAAREANLPAPPAASNPSTHDNDAMQSARFIDTPGRTEMHIDLRTQAFGSVELHTLIRDNQVGVAVGNERGDLRAWLGAEIPNLQNSFRQQDLHFSDIRFLGQSAGSGLGSGLSGGADSRPQSYHSRATGTSESQEPAAVARVPGEADQHAAPRGLNVHA